MRPGLGQGLVLAREQVPVPPKSRAGTRTVTMPAGLTEVLAGHLGQLPVDDDPVAQQVDALELESGELPPAQADPARDQYQGAVVGRPRSEEASSTAPPRLR